MSKRKRIGYRFPNGCPGRRPPEEREAVIRRAHELLAAPFTKETVFGDLAYIEATCFIDADRGHSGRAYRDVDYDEDA